VGGGLYVTAHSPSNVEENQITHLVLREGHLWGQKDVAIPVSEIERIGRETVHLKLDKRRVAALPALRLSRL